MDERWRIYVNRKLVATVLMNANQVMAMGMFLRRQEGTGWNIQLEAYELGTLAVRSQVRT